MYQAQHPPFALVATTGGGMGESYGDLAMTARLSAVQVNRLYTAATDELLNALHCDGSVLLQDPEEIDEAEIARRFAQRKVI